MVKVDMKPAVVDLAGIRAGDRNLVRFFLTSDGVPVNLTGYTCAAQARTEAADPDPPALTAVVAIVDAAGGELSVVWPGAAVTTVLSDQPTWSGVWDLQIDPGAGDPVTVAAGTFTAEQDVTRP